MTIGGMRGLFEDTNKLRGSGVGRDVCVCVSGGWGGGLGGKGGGEGKVVVVVTDFSMCSKSVAFLICEQVGLQSPNRPGPIHVSVLFIRCPMWH